MGVCGGCVTWLLIIFMEEDEDRAGYEGGGKIVKY